MQWQVTAFSHDECEWVDMKPPLHSELNKKWQGWKRKTHTKLNYYITDCQIGTPTPTPAPTECYIVMFYTTYICTQHTLGSHLHSRVHKHLLIYSFVLFIWVGNFVSFRFCSKTTTSQRRLHCENQSPYFPIQIFHRNLNVSDSVALLRTLKFNEWIQRNISSFRLVKDLKCGLIVWLVPTWPLRLAGSAEQWRLKQKINS